MFPRHWQPSRTFIIAAAIAIAVTAGLQMSRTIRPLPQVPFSDFLSDVEQGTVAAIAIEGDAFEIKRTSGEIVRTIAPFNYLTLNASVAAGLARKGVRIDFRQASAPPLLTYGPLLLGVGVLLVVGVAMFK